ncbi:MAG TPA: multiheme c-type cytochrome [Kofleriaceae bacterium]|nr:multiheme c-type cytochrome [Kofleriaceae bacterium]
MRPWAAIALAACGTSAAAPPRPAPGAAPVAARLPSTPGVLAPSLVQIVGAPGGDRATGAMLADVDSCASCHPDAAAQWSASAHSFASFGNPIYRANVELARDELGRHASNHCAGCHDMPLATDGLMAGDIPSDDLRAHSGVTCRLCHGVQSVTKDGNGSYVWSRAPIEAPDLNDPASIARHRAQVSVKSLGTELCVGCHRGFLSPDMGAGMPVHLTGLDEPGAWRSSAWAGNGMGRVDAVQPKNCIDCHMEREPASAAEYGAKSGTIASHRFLGGHTWMAAMRGDLDQLHRTQAKLEGIASIDVQPAPLVAGGARSFDVVVRNLLVGHRFPGGVLDIQDTWIEVEARDAAGRVIAQSGQAHERDARDEEAHVLRTLVVDEHGEVLEHHEMAKFRTQIATQTIAPRDASVVRYALPEGVTAATVTARLRHRSRTLAMQDEVCRAAKTATGQKFLAGAKGARDVVLDPCKPQPITLIAETTVAVGAKSTDSPSSWEREYVHGMALVAVVTERLDEARAVLEQALHDAPDGSAQAMVLVQLAWVADKQGRADDALALVAYARALLAPKSPAVLDAIAAEAQMRVWKFDAAVAPAAAAAKRAPGNAAAWTMLARCYGSVGDDADELAAATTGLELAPRDPDLLRSQATALAALHRPEAPAALAAYDRFRSPDASAELRISCAADSARCARDREQGSTIAMHVVH